MNDVLRTASWFTLVEESINRQLQRAKIAEILPRQATFFREAVVEYRHQKKGDRQNGTEDQQGSL